MRAATFMEVQWAPPAGGTIVGVRRCRDERSALGLPARVLVVAGVMASRPGGQSTFGSFRIADRLLLVEPDSASCRARCRTWCRRLARQWTTSRGRFDLPRCTACLGFVPRWRASNRQAHRAGLASGASTATPSGGLSPGVEMIWDRVRPEGRECQRAHPAGFEAGPENGRSSQATRGHARRRRVSRSHSPSLRIAARRGPYETRVHRRELLKARSHSARC